MALHSNHPVAPVKINSFKDELMSNVNSNIYGNSPNFGGVVGALNLPTKEHCGADQSIFIYMLLTRAFTVFNNSMNLPFLHFPKCFSNNIADSLCYINW